jgi:primosomal protein N' (replication factor Y)
VSHQPTPSVLRVAIPTPLRRSFDYLPPKDIAIDSLKPGMRLRLPFGRSEVIGILLEITQQTQVAAVRLKRAIQLLDAEPILNPDLLWLLNWASQYYQHPIGEVVQQALPTLLRQGRPAHSKGLEYWRLTPEGQNVDPAALSRAPRQAELLTLLKKHSDGMSSADLNRHHPQWRPVIARLADKNWVAQSDAPPAVRASHQPAESRPELNSAQQQAVQQILSTMDQYHAYLLDGVTGSGKTEVYLRTIESLLADNKQALILVPEIGLTPQLLNRFQRRFPDVQIAVLHSGLNDQERLQAWLSAAKGIAGIIIGTRSALLTPLARPGMIIVDEEHDLSFKQQEGFRYSARDLAVVRARHLNIPVILGSATPALESLYNCDCQRFTRLHLPERAGIANPPEFRLLDVRSQKLEHGLSAQLLHHIRSHLDADGQVLLFINRRGFAPVLMCHNCGWHARCQRCDAHMTVHQHAHRLRCHHCGSERPLPPRCPDCDSTELLQVGYGTERVEQALQAHFPATPILRIDRDTTRRKGAMQAMLEQIKQGNPHILIGTQMLAKGHHFPNLTLVGLLDADYGLFSADFRAAERLGQLVLQVAGRAGRGQRRGEVLIQTHHPESPLLHSLLTHDYGRFARTLLAERQAANLPPFSHLTLLRAEAVDPRAPLQFLEEARSQAVALGCAGIEFYGPFPAPMERRAGRSRAQLLLQAGSRASLQKVLAPWLLRLETLKSGRKVRWSIDVDPLEMF